MQGVDSRPAKQPPPGHPDKQDDPDPASLLDELEYVMRVLAPAGQGAPHERAGEVPGTFDASA